VDQFGGLGIGYLFALAALLFVLVYFLVVTRLLHLFAPHEVMVPTYEAPPEVSPAVAAWLFDRNDLPHSMAAAIVNMAAKKYLRIEQNEGSCSPLSARTRSLFKAGTGGRRPGPSRGVQKISRGS
jgi:Predicted membrane protein (DUF2207)